MSTEVYQPTEADRANVKMQPGELKLSGDQVFFTVQGEGESMGKSAVFLRLHTCNLACSWCDTKYTWDRTSKEFWQESENWSIEKTTEEITQYPTKRLVITGGEPLIQQRQIESLIGEIPDWNVEVETNGTIAPNPALAERCQFNVSPKLSNSGNTLNKRYKPEVLKRFNQLPKTTFKFVVQGETDLQEVDEVVSECEIDSEKVIIMAEGTIQDVISKISLAIVDPVRDRGYRLLPRMHVMLWGDKRGI